PVLRRFGFVTLLLLLLLLSLTSFAAEMPQPQMRVSMPDGNDLSLPFPSSDLNVIVQFRAPLSAMKTTRAAAIAAHRQTVQQFRSDLASMSRAMGKQATDPVIGRAFVQTFDGVSLTIPRSSF